MVALLFLVIFGGVVIGFAIWATAFGGMKRRGQSSTGEMEKRPVKQQRASGRN